MANIKKGLKRIDRVLFVWVCLGMGLIVWGLYKDLSTRDVENFFLVFVAPYIVFKLIYWIVMGFLDEKE